MFDVIGRREFGREVIEAEGPLLTLFFSRNTALRDRVGAIRCIQEHEPEGVSVAVLDESCAPLLARWTSGGTRAVTLLFNDGHVLGHCGGMLAQPSLARLLRLLPAPTIGESEPAAEEPSLEFLNVWFRREEASHV